MALEIEGRNEIGFCCLQSYISSFICGQCILGWDDGPIVCSLEDVVCDEIFCVMYSHFMYPSD